MSSIKCYIKDYINKIINENLSFTAIKNDIQQQTTSYIDIKEDGDLFILYHGNQDEVNNKENAFCIMEKDTMNIIASQYNSILYNDDAIKLIKECNLDFNNPYIDNLNINGLIIEKSYDGTILMLYCHNDNWILGTNQYIDISDVVIKHKSYKEMFEDAIYNKIIFDDLDKDYCYYFMLLHHKDRNIINYANLGYGATYADVVHIKTIEKYTLKEIDYTINKIKRPDTFIFNSLDHMLLKLAELNIDNESKKIITAEGYTCILYDKESKNTKYTLKLQTTIFQTLLKIKPNNSNMHQNYLELYQLGILSEYLPYFSRYNTDIIKRIHTSMRTVAKEILDIYHGTRQKKSPDTYNNLREQYKKILYGLHGIFINIRKPEYGDANIIANRSITVHDVYHYIKSLPPNQLRQLYYDRMHMLECEIYNDVLDKQCLDTLTLSTLMFQNII